MVVGLVVLVVRSVGGAPSRPGENARKTPERSDLVRTGSASLGGRVTTKARASASRGVGLARLRRSASALGALIAHLNVLS